MFRKDGTAQGVAKQRLIESLAKSDRRVIYDPYAENFVLGSIIIKLFGHKFNVWLSKFVAPGFHEHLIARTRYIDDLVLETSKKIDQYVILGAGYDSRAHRLKLPSTLKIFEVDQHDVQNLKLSRLPKNNPNSINIKYIGINFNKHKVTDQLLNAGFNINKPTLFTIEGVSQYIPKSTLASTLEEIKKLTEHKNSTLYISYVNSKLKTNPTSCFGVDYKNPVKTIRRILSLSEKVGEPWISFYSDIEMEKLLTLNGFELKENKTLSDLNTLYFGPVGRKLYDYEVFNLEHSVKAIKRPKNNSKTT